MFSVIRERGFYHVDGHTVAPRHGSDVTALPSIVSDKRPHWHAVALDADLIRSGLVRIRLDILRDQVFLTGCCLVRHRRSSDARPHVGTSIAARDAGARGTAHSRLAVNSGDPMNRRGARRMATQASVGDPLDRPNKGFHPLLDEPLPYLFVDACMQAWRDADYANAHRHGVTAYGVTAILPRTSEVDIGRTADSTLERAIDDVMFFHLVARLNPNMLVATTAGDIRRARADNRAAFVLSAQDGDWIGRQLHRIEALYLLGLRVMLPVYNASNQIGAGCLDRDDAGLTRFGALVVDECNRLGLLLDGCHVGRRTTLEMMERSTQPVVFTHANVDALCPGPRNVTDEQIRACAVT